MATLEVDLHTEEKRRVGTENDGLLEQINENIQTILATQIHMRADTTRAVANKNRRQKSLRSLRGIDESQYQIDRNTEKREAKGKKTAVNKAEVTKSKTEHER